MELIERVFTLLFTECGVIAVLELMMILTVAYVVRVLWRKIEEKDERIEELAENFLAALNNNTEVLTKIDDKLDKHSE